MALLAHYAKEAVLEHAAAQERLELLAHILGQRSVLRLKTRNQIRDTCASQNALDLLSATVATPFERSSRLRQVAGEKAGVVSGRLRFDDTITSFSAHGECRVKKWKQEQAVTHPVK